MGTKISELLEADSVSGNEVVPIVSNEATKKVKVSTILKEHSNVMKLTVATAKGATVTLSTYYKVGAGVLDLYLNGERLTKSSNETGTDGYYVEVGELGTISNQIKLTSDWQLDVGDILSIIVRGEWGNDTSL